jgi:DNA helicase HerA-like ATPase
MERILLGAQTGNPDNKLFLDLKWANRHGLIAGATGTGKTVTLQVMAEGFSAAGVPVFMADVKGDLSGICMPSEMQDFLVKRAADIGFVDYRARSFPATFWDLFGQGGHPVRTTISEVGPLLLARMLELNDVQEGVLNVVFRLADDEGLLLLDLDDLRALLAEVGERASEISVKYGQVSKQSIGTIQRALLRLEDQGGKGFFGEPALRILDLMRTDMDGNGYINILSADKLMSSPRLYASFLLWLLNELFEELPEAGDLSKPKLVFFFDEAHLLFDDAPKSLLDKIEQVIRLIRSKGVGIFFVTQNPDDVPETVLGQLGCRVQHALRAFTPQQQKTIKVAAQTYRANDAFDVEKVITELGVGEALVSTLEGKGAPSVVQRAMIRPPSSRLGPVGADEKRMVLKADGIGAVYDQSIDRESAQEILQAQTEEVAARGEEERENVRGSKKSSSRQSTGEAFVKSIVRAAGSSLGRQIMREVVRGILGGMRR